MRLNQYRDVTFTPGSKPSITTVKKWIMNGDIAGEIIGGNYYVNTDKVAAANDLVLKVLQK